MSRGSKKTIKKIDEEIRDLRIVNRSNTDDIIRQLEKTSNFMKELIEIFMWVETGNSTLIIDQINLQINEIKTLNNASKDDIYKQIGKTTKYLEELKDVFKYLVK